MGWTFVKQTGRYSAFASDIESYLKESKKQIRCPVCRKAIPTKVLFKFPKQVGDEPRACFTLTHYCKNRPKMIIWND